MREILFRGKDIVGNWHIGNLAIVKKDIYNEAGTIKVGSYISNSCGVPFAYQVRPETVGQFTGLLDKNGKKIFEGDIIRDEDSWARGEVFFNNNDTGGYCTWFLGDGYNCSLSFLDSTNIEIIGNIQDNPELLT